MNEFAAARTTGVNPGAGQQAGHAPTILPLPPALTAARLPAAEPPRSRRRLPRVLRSVLGAGVLLPAAVLLFACSKPPEMPAFERPPAPVQVAAAVARDVPVYLDEIGHAVARETVQVRAQVGGRVEEARFTEGVDVRKGDVLFVLDARPFQARLDAADAALLRAQATLVRAQAAVLRPQASVARARAARELAVAEFRRVESLADSKAVSRADYDAKKSAVAISDAELAQAEADLKQAEPEEREAQAAVKAAEAAIASARLDVEYCTIRSPLDGRAGRRLVDPGNLVAANGVPLVTIESLQPIRVDFTIPEHELGAVQRNMARGTLRVEVRLPGDAAEPRTGELSFLDNTVQESTGTVKLSAAVDNVDRRFWPGRFVKVRLVLDTLPAAVLVPTTATQMSGKGPFVYVAKDDATAELRPVTLGQRQGELVVVAEGVRAGERVVVTGQIAVTPGGKILVAAPTESASAAPAKTGGDL